MQIWKYFFGILILASSAVWLAVFSVPSSNLHIIACDVGQGDAILATYKNIQILTDGGPNNKVLDCLGKYMPFWDREIELVVLTHPQKDHYQGLIEVFKRYKVDNFLANSLDSSSQEYQALKKEVGSSGVRELSPMAGLSIRGGLIYLDVVNPEGECKEANINNCAIVSRLKYKNFKALLTGDIENKISNKLYQEGRVEKVNYLKVPHHGSKNGLTEGLLNAINPEVAVISVGRNNTYGLPDEEILKMLSGKNIKILRTDQSGDVEITTDGNKWWIH